MLIALTPTPRMLTRAIEFDGISFDETSVRSVLCGEVRYLTAEARRTPRNRWREN